MATDVGLGRPHLIEAFLETRPLFYRKFNYMVDTDDCLSLDDMPRGNIYASANVKRSSDPPVTVQ